MIAGKYRDQVDINSMPLAAQILGMVQIICIIVPITIAILIDGILNLISGTHYVIGDCASILLLAASIIPIWKTFKKEFYVLKLRCKKKESASINVDYVDFYTDRASVENTVPATANACVAETAADSTTFTLAFVVATVATLAAFALAAVAEAD